MHTAYLKSFCPEGLLAAAPDEESRQLVREYGVAADAVWSLMPASAAGPLTPLERARIAYAVRYEMARRIEDLMYVSTYWGYEREWTAESLQPYVDAMAAC